MMYPKLLFVFCFFFLQIKIAASQDTLKVDLEGIIALAQSDAPDVLIAKTRLSNRYWQYQSFLADYRPQIDFQASLPNLNRSIDRITIPDGTDIFVQRSLMNNSIGFSLSQNITATGGQVFASTSLERIDIFKTQLNPASSSYLNIPISINFVQPLFAFNQLKWDKQIEPIRYEEATRAFAEEMEQIAFQGAQLFFRVFSEQLNVAAAERQKANADTLFNISQGRFSVGRIAETDLLQIELRARNADANLARARLNFQTTTEQLRNFLGLETPVVFDLNPPTDIPTYELDATQALKYANNNRSQSLSLDLQLLNAERAVAQAKANSNPEVNLFASFGLSQQATSIGGTYNDLLDREVVNVGMTVPIADWGKARSRRAIAQSNLELTQMIVAQDRVNFEREILLNVQQFNLVRDQVNLALSAYEVAQKRQDITQQRYLIGKVSLTDLNISIDESESARQAYILALQNFWLAHYELRFLTLFDFDRNASLVKTVEVEK